MAGVIAGAIAFIFFGSIVFGVSQWRGKRSKANDDVELPKKATVNTTPKNPMSRQPLRTAVAQGVQGELATFLRGANLSKHADSLARIGMDTLQELRDTQDAKLQQSAGLSRIEIRVLRKRLGERDNGGACSEMQLEMTQRTPGALLSPFAARVESRRKTQHGLQQDSRGGEANLDDEADLDAIDNDKGVAGSFAALRGIRGGGNTSDHKGPELHFVLSRIAATHQRIFADTAAALLWRFHRMAHLFSH
jgi:hypothetical protein